MDVSIEARSTGRRSVEIKKTLGWASVEKKILDDEKKFEIVCSSTETTNDLAKKQKGRRDRQPFTLKKELNYAAAGANSGAPAT